MTLADFSFSDPYALIGILVAISLAPFVALMVTSYIKLVVVFNLIRNALGVQQIPPNMVLNGMALILSLYIMYPIIQDTFAEFRKYDYTKMKVEEGFATAAKSAEPLKKFLLKNTKEKDRNIFLKSSKKLWGEQRAAEVKADDFIILVPAFTVSELSSAFQVGFLIYLPFLIVDLVVSNILLAMGMMMMSPVTIALPFKLLLFVIANGWTKLIQGLLFTYH